MNMFYSRLDELIQECGGRLATSPRIKVCRPREESFIAIRGVNVGDSCMAIRTIQPLKIEVIIEIEAEFIGEWRHASGDNRRLHPDLKSSE